MFNKILISGLIAASAVGVVVGQTADEKKDKLFAPQGFAFSFDGDGGYLGVQTQDVTKENFAKFGLREVRGVAIAKVVENSPAAAAGLQYGDVITKFNGDEVTSARKLTRLVGEVAPDHQVKLTVLRGGGEKEITATLGKNPTPAFGDGNFSYMMPMEKFKDMPQFDFKMAPDMKDMPQFKGFDMDKLKDLPQGEGWKTFELPGGGQGKSFTWSSGGSRQIGAAVYPVTKQLGEQYGVDGGVLVNEVRENSPAAKAGLKAGDVIVEVDGKAVKDNFELVRSINDKKDGAVNLTIVRDRKRQTISVTPEASKDGGMMFKMDKDNG